MIVVSVCLRSDALSVPTVLLGFLLPWTWGISSRLLQQSAAAASELGHGVALGWACASNQNREITPVVKTSAFDQYKRALCWSYGALSQISKLVKSSEISSFTEPRS